MKRGTFCQVWRRIWKVSRQHQRSKGDKGDSLKFEDLTSDQIAQIKAKDVDLSAYATKAELKEIDVSKQLADYLSKAEANSTYAKASHKHSLSDITDLNLDRYATKIELQNKASTYHRHRTSDIDGIDEYLKQTDLPQDIVKQSDIRDVVRNAQLSGYVRLADIQYQLNNIGKLKDVATGQYLSVRVVDKGKVPYNTSGLIVLNALEVSNGSARDTRHVFYRLDSQSIDGTLLQKPVWLSTNFILR